MLKYYAENLQSTIWRSNNAEILQKSSVNNMEI